MSPLRPPEPGEITALAKLWHDAWHEAHAAYVSQELLAVRDLESFRTRLAALAPDVRAAWDGTRPLGLCAVSRTHPGELNQLFVAPAARGTGIARALLADGEARLAAAGCLQPVLNVLPENARARAFYRREGWRERGEELQDLATATGSVSHLCVVMEKNLSIS